jgi:hypothetical protein
LAAGVPPTGPTRPRRRQFPALADQDWRCAGYVGEHASLQEFVGEIGCSNRAVRHALTEAQVPMRPQGQWKCRRSSTRAPADTNLKQ